MTAAAAARLLALVASVVLPPTVRAQAPELSGNWIRSRVTFGEWVFTEEGARRFKAYDFRKDDPAYGCIGSSWTRIWMNPNVVVRITPDRDHVRLQYEWMDVDRRVPLGDPAAADVVRGRIEGMPALGRSMGWYDGDTLVIDTIDVEPGYVTTMQEWAGMPQSRRMRTVERLRRSGDTLTIEITHHDPAYYRRPLIVTIEYRRTDFELMEYGCSPEEASVVSPR